MKSQKLQFLLKKELGVDIQEGEHDSIDDARATLLLYKKHRVEWEEELRKKDHFKHKKHGKWSVCSDTLSCQKKVTHLAGNFESSFVPNNYG